MTFDGSVRPAGEGDLAAVSEIYDHYIRTSHATFDVEPMSAERRRVWFEEHPGGRHRALVAVDGRWSRAAGVPRPRSNEQRRRYRPRPAYDTRDRAPRASPRASLSEEGRKFAGTTRPGVRRPSNRISIYPPESGCGAGKGAVTRCYLPYRLRQTARARKGPPFVHRWRVVRGAIDGLYTAERGFVRPPALRRELAPRGFLADSSRRPSSAKRRDGTFGRYWDVDW